MTLYEIDERLANLPPGETFYIDAEASREQWEKSTGNMYHHGRKEAKCQ
jgi:hypothetical protein